MKLLLQIGLFIIIVAACCILFAFPVKWLWNWLMPELFSLKQITFWQALGLSLLCSLLFKSNHSKSKD